VVRHLPTGWVVGGEGMNALAFVRAMLGQHERAIAPPALVREYSLAPAPRVRDHRTGRETRDVEAVLGGAIDEFLES